MIIQAILISLKITLFALCITMLFSILLTWLGSFKISFYKKKTDWLITLPMFFHQQLLDIYF